VNVRLFLEGSDSESLLYSGSRLLLQASVQCWDGVVLKVCVVLDYNIAIFFDIGKVDQKELEDIKVGNALVY